jgi:D-cysteine desulfhydrase
MPVTPPPRVELAQLPTPLVPLLRLSAQLGNAQIWAKRDDLTGLEVTGNKIRKIEYVFGDAIGHGCDTIVTEGAGQSNHCRATAAAAARAGLHAHLLLRDPAAHGDQGNYLLDRIFGAGICHCDPKTYARDRDAIIARELDALRAQGRQPRWTPKGASEPVGCWGYIRGLAELAVQLKDNGIDGCDLVVACSSGGTLAGLLLGKLLYRLNQVDIWGVPVSDDVAFHTSNVAGLCRQTIEQFGLPVEWDATVLRLIDGYVGEGYAIPYPKALAAIGTLARQEALVLDPVYTAKAFAALIDAVHDNRLGSARPVVFLHTGGMFSNFAWPQRMLAASDAGGRLLDARAR